jgi:hypothetical protein
MRHDDSGKCAACLAKFDAYPGFYAPLKAWFIGVQIKHPAFHVAEAGRGKIDQEIDYARGASRAHFGESAHNWNAAIDTFFQINGSYDLSPEHFDSIVPHGLISEVKWYGMPGAPFFERPHFEWRDWWALRDAGKIKLVE